MIINNTLDIKLYYRFIEFTSKLVGIKLPHERFKQIALNNYKVESENEIYTKNLSEAYLYLINNVNQTLTKEILNKTYYLLTNEILKEEIALAILEKYYQNYDETSHYLVAIIHLLILSKIEKRNIEYAFMISNFIMLKKQRYPLIIHEGINDKYFKAIKENSLDELMIIFSTIEAIKTKETSSNLLNQETIIQTVSKHTNDIKKFFEVKKLYLYGSYAKKETTIYSDIDLLVVFNDDCLNIKKNIYVNGLTNYSHELLHIKVDIIDFSHALRKLDINEMENIITLI